MARGSGQRHDGEEEGLMSAPLRIGMIGYGFMGRAHSNAYRRLPNFFPELARQPELVAVCGRDRAKTEAFAATWGYGAVETDWRRLIARADVDAVDVCVPNNLHKEIAIAAAEAGKIILCEKPLAMDVADGEAMAAAVRKAGVPTMVWYNYRRIPAVSLARQLIDEGRIGRVFHYRANFLQDWTISADVPQGGAALWRLDVDTAGSGVTGDLLAHNIDTAPERWSRSASTTPACSWRVSPMARWACSRARATRAATRRLRRLR
jgi:predicted dehydrogenase